MKHGGLFEGYGGTTSAAEKIFGPLDRAWYSDIKPASVTLLEASSPRRPQPRRHDHRRLDQVEPVDVLTASWPCQPHASAGKRLGAEDPRALWPHVILAIDAVRPAYFCGENVARIAGNGELRRVVRTLADLGYMGAWRCITAASVGAPHKRDRCFVVAVRAERLLRHIGRRPNAVATLVTPCQLQAIEERISFVHDWDARRAGSATGYRRTSQLQRLYAAKTPTTQSRHQGV